MGGVYAANRPTGPSHPTRFPPEVIRLEKKSSGRNTSTRTWLRLRTKRTRWRAPKGSKALWTSASVMSPGTSLRGTWGGSGERGGGVVGGGGGWGGG